jgi:hypothetical protein
VASSSAITAIGAGKGIEFGSHKMFAARATMSASAENAYLVNKIAFFHYLKLPGKSK